MKRAIWWCLVAIQAAVAIPCELGVGTPSGTVGLSYYYLTDALCVPYPWDPCTPVSVSGSLPPGLTWDIVGYNLEIKGIPTAPGTFSFTVGAWGGGNCPGWYDIPAQITINCPSPPPPPLTVNPPTIPDTMRGQAYSSTFSASGGTAPYRFGLSQGSLPPGLKLASWGTLSGVPTTAGDYSFEIEAKDATYCARGTRIYAIRVEAEDHVVGRGLGSLNPPEVRVFTSSGTPTSTVFYAYGTSGWGVNVATTLLDMRTEARLLTASGPGAVYGPQIRGFRSDGTAIASVNFYAFGTLKYGANTSAGNLEPSAFEEMIAGAGPAQAFGPHVRGFRYQGTKVSAIAGVSFFAYAGLSSGVNVAGGDVDGDGFDEIVTGPGPAPANPPEVRGYNYDGSSVTSIPGLDFFLPGLQAYGAVVACGSLIGNGADQIVAAPGPSPALQAIFRGYQYQAGSVSQLPGCEAQPYVTYYGGRAGAGIGLATGLSRDQLLAAPGPDPSATPTIVTLDYDGSALNPLVSFAAFTGGYGANVAAGPLGL